MEFTNLQYVLGAGIAIGVGFLTGIFGVGGGFLLTPALMIFVGIPGEIAVGTGLATILVSSSVGLLKRRGTATVDSKLGVMLGMGSIAGVLIGLFIIKHLKTMDMVSVLGKQQNLLQLTLLCLFLVLLILIAVFISYDVLKLSKGRCQKQFGFFSRISIRPFIEFESLDQPSISLVPIELLGLLVGILTGLLGIGGGIVVMPALIYLVGQRAVKAAGTSLLLVWISSLFGAGGHFIEGNIHWQLLVIMATGSSLGVWIGTHVGLSLDECKLRLYFMMVVIAAAFTVGFKLLQLLI